MQNTDQTQATKPEDAKVAAAAEGGDKKLYLDDVTGEMVSKK